MKKEVRYITRKSIRNIQICCIWMYVFFSGVRVYASTAADSVYFRIKADTIREIRAGQVVELTYALVNSTFDTASYPVFNDNIEVVSGPKQHKCSSYTLVNGVGSKSDETCFSYLVRFRKSGKIQLPAASVTVGNRTYTTPEFRVHVNPAEVDRRRLKCSLNVEQLVGDYVRYCATLTCNTRPDQNPPLLSINGETTRPSSISYSGSEGKEEYVYRYYFNSEGYKVACEKLTFGGKAYKLQPRKCKKRH